MNNHAYSFRGNAHGKPVVCALTLYKIPVLKPSAQCGGARVVGGNYFIKMRLL